MLIKQADSVVVPADGEKPIGSGDCVVEPNETHQFRNTGPEELKFLGMVPKTSK